MNKLNDGKNMIVWKYADYFRYTDHFKLYLVGRHKIKYGFRYFNIWAKKVSWRKREYECLSWTEEGPLDCLTISYSENIGVRTLLSDAKVLCNEYTNLVWDNGGLITNSGV